MGSATYKYSLLPQVDARDRPLQTFVMHCCNNSPLFIDNGVQIDHEVFPKTSISVCFVRLVCAHGHPQPYHSLCTKEFISTILHFCPCVIVKYTCVRRCERGHSGDDEVRCESLRRAPASLRSVESYHCGFVVDLPHLNEQACTGCYV